MRLAIAAAAAAAAATVAAARSFIVGYTGPDAAECARFLRSIDAEIDAAPPAYRRRLLAAADGATGAGGASSPTDYFSVLTERSHAAALRRRLAPTAGAEAVRAVVSPLIAREHFAKIAAAKRAPAPARAAAVAASAPLVTRERRFSAYDEDVFSLGGPASATSFAAAPDPLETVATRWLKFVRMEKWVTGNDEENGESGGDEENGEGVGAVDSEASFLSDDAAARGERAGSVQQVGDAERASAAGGVPAGITVAAISLHPCVEFCSSDVEHATPLREVEEAPVEVAAASFLPASGGGFATLPAAAAAAGAVTPQWVFPGARPPVPFRAPGDSAVAAGGGPSSTAAPPPLPLPTATGIAIPQPVRRAGLNETRAYVASIWGQPRTPNDELFGALQWDLVAVDAAYAWKLREERGMHFGYRPNSMVVAVTDNGIDLTHPELAPRLWKNEGEICDNGVDDDGNGYVDDCYGWNFRGNNNNLTEASAHGTPVAGVVAAETDNGLFLASVCPDCRIMPLRVALNAFSTNAFAEAVNYAIAHGAKIVNYSSSGAYSAAQMRAIDAAGANDVVIAVCAGNEACDLDDRANSCGERVGFPNRLKRPNMLTVGSVAQTGELKWYSNRGNVTVDLLAPGGISLIMPNSAPPRVVQGTSFSAPMVAGVAGLVRSFFPTLSAAQTVDCIRNTCLRNTRYEGLAFCPGIIDAPAAMSAAGRIVSEKIGAPDF